MSRYHASLVRVARYYVASEATAEDRGARNVAGRPTGCRALRGSVVLQTWLFHILVNRARSIGERERRAVPVDPLSTERTVAADRFDQGGFWIDPPEPFTESIDNALANGPLVDWSRLDRATARAGAGGCNAARRRRTVHHGGRRTPRLTEANVRVILHRGRARIRSEVEASMRVGES